MKINDQYSSTAVWPTEPTSTVSITFNNLSDEEAKAITKWRDYWLVLWDLDRKLRDKTKYGDQYVEDLTPYEDIRETLWSIMEMHGVSLDDLS